MRIATLVQWSVGSGVALAALVGGRSAKAAEAESGKPATGEAREGEGEGKAEEEHEVGMLAVDLVLGWGKVPFAVQNQPTGGNQGITYTRSDSTESDVQSFLLGGSLELGEHFGVGARLPLTFATFSPDGAPSRSTSGVGNLELEGEYSAPIARGLRFIGALGVALPTADGTEIPEGLTGQSAASVNSTLYDRWSMSKAASYARGYEDNALFDPQRFGLVPKVGLLYGIRGLTLEPAVKVENLIGTSSTLDARYVGEVVASLRVGYWVHRDFEISVKGWVNAGFAGTGDDKVTAVSLYPQLVLEVGPVRPYAGVIVPLSGPPSDNGFVGVRLGVAVAL